MRTGEAIVFDPQRDVDRCIEVAARGGLRIAAVAETRIHTDFLSGSCELAERTGAVVLTSGVGATSSIPCWINRYAHRLMRDGDTFDLGTVQIQAMHAPGATAEQLIYLVHDRSAAAYEGEPMGAVVGEFLNNDGLTRSEHPSHSAVATAADRSAAEVWRLSLQRLLSLSDWMQIWPSRAVRTAAAHTGALPQTTVGFERRFGYWAPLLHDEEAFADAVCERRRERDGCTRRIRATNLEGVPLLTRMPTPQVLTSLDEHADLLDPAICTVIDTRAWTVFRAGHIVGSLHAPLGRNLASSVGEFLEPDERVVLVCDPSHTDELVRECVRSGIDRVEAVVPPALLHLHRHKLRTAPEVGVEAAVLALTTDDVQMIDVREGTECACGMIAGALRVPPSRLMQRVPDLLHGKVIVYCTVGSQSATAVSVLRRMGVDAVNLAGGYEAWRRAGHAIVVPGGFDEDPACSLGLAPAKRAIAG